ncbi:hypothetical protein PVAG01_02786 [Phlyctema vagabunda]|uniref:Uncharacterized protein n=1 Tax=Phlyctema vagabunda TaxID=108571 RepID=A0ABR4PRK2_9HELO
MPFDGKSKSAKKDSRSKKSKSSSQSSSKQQDQNGAHADQSYTTIQRDWPTEERSFHEIDEQQAAAGTTNFNSGYYTYSTGHEGSTPMERFERETQRQSAWNNVFGYTNK